MRGSYPERRFLSRTKASGLAPPIDGLLTPPRASSTPAQHTNNLSPCAQRDHNLQRTEAPHTVLLRCRAASGVAHTPDTAHPTHHLHPAHDTPPSAAHTRHGAGLVPLPRALASRAPRTAASGPHQPRVHNAHTKTRPDQPVRARNAFGSGVRTLAVVRAVLTTIATLTTPLRHVILLGFVV